ncbi:endonuclease domain-containing protein [Amycolatopsis thailandensis]|uniref:endonuclease domain-containing protein n=1 Tax=Amycolatopsis thailandensis TaxID=589330 RepID=UPI0037A5CEE2
MIDWGGRHGAVSRSEADSVLGRRMVVEGLAAGVLAQPWRGVVIHSADALKLTTRAQAALLVVGQPAALSEATSLALHGLSAVDDTRIHVTVPHSRRIKSKPGLSVHQADFRSSDVVEIDGLATFSLDLALADFLCAGDKRTAFATLDEAMRGLAPDHVRVLRENVRDRLADRRDRRGIHRALLLLDLATGKAESPPESILRLIVAEAGFPVPEVQYEITTIEGRKLYVLDMAWPSLRIALEYDGFASHEERRDYDAERDARMAGRGWVTIRASAADLRDPRRLLAELTRAFEMRAVA